MKSIIFSFLLLSTTLSFFPFTAFSSTFTSDDPIVLPTTTEDNGRPVLPPEVLDINGEPLLIGQEYHIISAVWGAGGGGVYLTKIGNTKCPNAVVQHGMDTQQGNPVKFLTRFPTSPPFDVIRETKEVEIMFSIPSTTPRCDDETYWMVDNPDVIARGTRFVVTSAIKTSPSILFKIEKVSETLPFYKLRHCPSRSICSDVGLTMHKGYRRLALTNQPFMVVFKKVQKCTDA